MAMPLDAVTELIERTSDVDLVELFRIDPEESPLTPIMRGIAAPNFETRLIASDGGLEATFTGIDGYVAAWRDWAGAFRSFSYHESRAPIAGDDVFINFVTQRAVIGEGGQELTAESAAVWRFDDDGVLHRIEYYLDAEQALQASGLA